MAKDWVMVRLPLHVHARLTEFLGTQPSWRTGNGELFKSPKYRQPSLADAVNELLDRVEAHRERSHRAQQKRRGAKPPVKELLEEFAEEYGFPGLDELVVEMEGQV
jgi:hypothetical protein